MERMTALLPRIVVGDVRPRAQTGDFPAKAVVGELVRVSADIFKDGHDVLAARALWRPCDKPTWEEVSLRHVENDRWEGVLEPTTLGSHEFVIETWTAAYATWRHKATTKVDAGQDVEVELEEGALLLERAATAAGDAEAQALLEGAAQLRDKGLAPRARMARALDTDVAELVEGPLPGDEVTRTEPHPLWVDRERALYSAWYELFPRSEGGLRGTAKRLPAIADMGFDVVYLPPIHPIGTTFRKGRNNTLDPLPDDPGSPWAIGGPEGGHTAIHPALGTFDDFDALVAAAHDLGMEIALDYALQCSPDHPWVTEHPEWFHQRPDGSIAYAENPPKKYQDIYPINFWPEKEKDRKALWQACLEIFEFWIGHGVRIFRVDNPHTKPIAFWAWVLPEVLKKHPDVLFLAEAFTRPKVMAKLAEVGFSQSYTYFTWRTEKWELEEYLEELAHGPKADFMRPNFWPNTPDILSGPLREGPLSAFKLRLVLAATLVPSYGIYSGYELGENEPASETNEEYLHSEKYEIKHRDWDDARSLAPFVKRINAIRSRHPALHRLRNIRFHGASNDNVIAFSKHTDDRSDIVLVVVNLDPRNVQDCTLTLDLGSLGLPWDAPFEAHDELTAQTFEWWGPNPYVRLDPLSEPAHLLHLRAR
jgi:starch synthase (maltosyl-transferring)